MLRQPLPRHNSRISSRTRGDAPTRPRTTRRSNRASRRIRNRSRRIRHPTRLRRPRRTIRPIRALPRQIWVPATGWHQSHATYSIHNNIHNNIRNNIHSSIRRIQQAPAFQQQAPPPCPHISRLIREPTDSAVSINGFLRTAISRVTRSSARWRKAHRGWRGGRAAWTAGDWPRFAGAKGRPRGRHLKTGFELTSITLADGQQLPIQSQMVTRNGQTSVGRDVGAVAGTTVLGAAVGAAADWAAPLSEQARALLSGSCRPPDSWTPHRGLP